MLPVILGVKNVHPVLAIFFPVAVYFNMFFCRID
jgi:hypothetical protein